MRRFYDHLMDTALPLVAGACIGLTAYQYGFKAGRVDGMRIVADLMIEMLSKPAEDDTAKWREM